MVFNTKIDEWKVTAGQRERKREREKAISLFIITALSFILKYVESK